MLLLLLLLLIGCSSAMETELSEESFEIIAYTTSTLEEDEFELIPQNTTPSTEYYPNASYFIVHGEQCEKWVCGTKTVLTKCPEKKEHNLIDWTQLFGDAQQKIVVTFYSRSTAKIKTEVIESPPGMGPYLWAQQKLDPHFLPLAYSAAIIINPENNKRSIRFKDATGLILSILPYHGSTELNNRWLTIIAETIDLSQLKMIADETAKRGYNSPNTPLRRYPLPSP